MDYPEVNIECANCGASVLVILYDTEVDEGERPISFCPCCGDELPEEPEDTEDEDS